jgi:hypothetical protein
VDRTTMSQEAAEVKTGSHSMIVEVTKWGISGVWMR